MAETDAVSTSGEVSRPRRLGRRRANAVAQGSAPAVSPRETSAEREAPAETQQKARPATRSAVRAFLAENVRLVLAVVLLVIGVILVLLGWYGAAHTNILTEQIPYLISGGLLGMALIIVAGVIGSSASLSRENREMHRDLAGAIGSTPATPLRSVPSPRSAPADGRAYIVPGGHSYHLAGCPIIEGKNGSDMSIDEATSAGYTTCKLCGPD